MRAKEINLQKNLHADENSFTYTIQHTVYYYFSSNLVPKASDKISFCMNQHVSTIQQLNWVYIYSVIESESRQFKNYF